MSTITSRNAPSTPILHMKASSTTAATNSSASNSSTTVPSAESRRRESGEGGQGKLVIIPPMSLASDVMPSVPWGTNGGCILSGMSPNVPRPLKAFFATLFMAYVVMLIYDLHTREGYSPIFHMMITSFIFVLIWLGIKYCNTNRGMYLQDLLITTLIYFVTIGATVVTKSMFHLIPIMLTPLAIQRSLIMTATTVTSVVYIVVVVVLSCSIAFTVDSSRYNSEELADGHAHFIFVFSALMPLAVIICVYCIMFTLLDHIDAIIASYCRQSDGQGSTDASHTMLASQSVNSEVHIVQSPSDQSNAMQHDTAPPPNPLVIDVHNLNSDNTRDDVEVMSYSENHETNATPTHSQTLSPITLSPLPTPRNYNDVKTPSDRHSSKESRPSSNPTPYTPTAYTPTKGRSRDRKLSSRGSITGITVAPAFRHVTVLCLALRRRDGQPHGGNDARHVFEEFFSLVAEEAVVGRGGHILPHIDSDVIFVSWGVYSLHENPCFASANCAVALHRRLADKGFLIHGSVVHGRVQCGTFSNPASSTQSHFRIIGSAARDAFALLDIGIEIGTACIVDETAVLRIGDFYTSRPVDTFPAAAGSTSIAGTGNNNSMKVAHEVLMPLFAPGSSVSHAMTEWHLLHEKREQMTKHFEKFLAAYEAYAAGRLQVAELLVKVYVDEVPGDKAGLRLMARVSDKMKESQK